MPSEILPGKEQQGPAEAPLATAGGRRPPFSPLSTGQCGLGRSPGSASPYPGPALVLPRGEGATEPLMLSVDSSPRAAGLQSGRRVTRALTSMPDMSDQAELQEVTF